MNVVFVHQNFPAQFGPLASHLAGLDEYRVAAICEETASGLPGVGLFRYRLGTQDLSATHVFARRFDLDCRRAEQVFYAAQGLLASGFRPDVVVAHHGWGETLPLRSIFPNARLVTYCEFFYQPKGADVAFDPADGPLSLGTEVALRAKNATALLALAESDAGLSPTQWQRSTFPPEFQRKIHVCHEGVDTRAVGPDPATILRLVPNRAFSGEDEVVTFVARDLEPLRGYLTLMQALPRILHERPRAHVLIVGGHGTSYGALPPDGDSWMAIGLRSVAAAVDRGRIHFLGQLPYADYLDVLRISSVHVYLSHPFVLSWSLVEAMAVGCAVVASDTAPCREVIDGSNGRLVDPLDPESVARAVVSLLTETDTAKNLGFAARQVVLRSFDRRDCLELQHRLLCGQPPSPPSS